MPERSRVEAFITVAGDDPVKAIEDFYHEDASMQENGEPPREGRAALVDFERKMLGSVQGMDARADAFAVDGDTVVIRWTFDMTDAKGVVRRLEELAWQEWRGDRIARERFYYDTRTAWQEVER